MRRSKKQTLLLVCGLMLATTVACTDRTTSRAPSAGGGASLADLATPEPAVAVPVTYTVVAGDFLSEIARRYDVTVTELAAANDIENPALIEVGQQLVIPGQQAVVGDPFFAAQPQERYTEIYPPPVELPPLPPTPLQELINRIEALPWPERERSVELITAGSLALTALVGGLMLTSAEFHTRRWAVRTLPRWGRITFHWWSISAITPRRTYLKVRRRAIAAWRYLQAGYRLARRGYARASVVAHAGWDHLGPVGRQISRVAMPVLTRLGERAREVGYELGVRAVALYDTVRDRAPYAADSVSEFRDRASDSLRRSVAERVQQRARRRELEPPPQQQQRWRTRVAGELANAFERHQLDVRYVPVIDLDSKTISAVEAHLFWRHPQRGLMAARDIYSATHDHPELDSALFEFLVESSCRFIHETVNEKFPSAQLVIPVTLDQMLESQPLAAIDWGLSNANLPIDRLVVSIDEPQALRDPRTSAAFIRNLRSMGIAVQLNDYGMAMADDLRQLGVSSVTVDFAAASASEGARGILTAAIDGAQELRLPVTSRHARSEIAQTLQVRLGCAYEAVGEPITEQAFIATQINKPRPVEAKPPPPTPSGGPVGRSAPPQSGTEAIADEPAAEPATTAPRPADAA